MSENKSETGKNFLVQGSILAIAGVITKIIGAVYRIPLVNILGDKGMGYYGVAFQIYAIALTLTSYSLPLAVSKLVSARLATGQYKNAYRVFRGAMTFAIAAGGIVGAIIFFGADFIASNLMAMKMSTLALRVLAPCILIVAILGVFRGFFQGNESMIPTAVSQIIEQIVNAVVSVVGAYMLLKVGKEVAAQKNNDSYGAAYAASGGTLGTVMGALAALLFLFFLFLAFRKKFRRQMERDRGNKTESYKRVFKVLLLTIAPVILSATVYNLCGVVDNAMFGTIMSIQGHKESEYAALLGIVTGKYDTLMNVPLAISSAFGSSLIPSIVLTAKTGNRRQVHEKIDIFTRFNMIIAIPCAAGFIVLAKPLLDLLFFTENNTLGGVLLQMGAISVVFYNLSTVTNAVLQGLDNMMVPVKSAAISLVIHIISLFLMMVVFKWGIYAVVLSKIVFSLSTCILNAHALRERIGYVQEQKKTFVIPAIASIIMGIVTLVVHLLFELFVGTRIATVIALCVAVAVYGVALVLLGGVTEKELSSMPKGPMLVKICKKAHLFRS